MKKIELTQKQVAIIDDEDFESVSKYKWHAHFDPKMGKFYAKSWWYPKDGSRRWAMGLHQFLNNTIGKGTKIHIDHINGDTLDNRRSNLCKGSPRKNSENRKDQSRYGVGVYKRKESGNYRGFVHIGDSRKGVGTYPTPELAQQARQRFIKENGLQ